MMRSVFAAAVLLALALAAGLYAATASEREYTRLIAAGDEAAARDEPFTALEAYSGAIALRPDAMPGYLKRGLTYAGQGQHDAAARDLRRAVELDPTATIASERLGDVYLALSRPNNAARRYEDYLALDDRSAAVWYKLALARYRAGDPARAIEPLQRALSLDDSLSEAHLLLGLCRRDIGDLRGAVAALQGAIARAPALTDARDALASVYEDLGDQARALDQLEALAALDGSRPERFVALGLAYARARRRDAAVLTLGRAAERFPGHAQIYAALGRVWLDAAAGGDRVSLNKALEALRAAAAHPDASSDTLRDLGRAWLMAGNLAAAAGALRAAAARRPVTPDVYRHLAEIAAREGRLDDARDALIMWVTLSGTPAVRDEAEPRILEYCQRLGDERCVRRWNTRRDRQSLPAVPSDRSAKPERIIYQ
jgi:tetratricopeptide (TPR) repeat protein